MSWRSVLHAPATWAMLVIVLLSGAWVLRPADDTDAIGSWPNTVLDRMAGLPVQSQGRIMPLVSYATVQLKGIAHRETLPLGDDTAHPGEKLNALSWFLDVAFAPERADDYPSFQIQDNAVIEGLGISLVGVRKKKRDRWSFNEIKPAFAKLFATAQNLEAREGSQAGWSRVERQTFALAGAVGDYLEIRDSFAWAGSSFSVPDGAIRRELQGAESVRFDALLVQGKGLGAVLDRWNQQLPAAAELAEGKEFYGAVENSVVTRQGMRVFPASNVLPGEAGARWRLAGELVQQAFAGKPIEAAHLELVRAWQTLADAVKSNADLTPAALDVVDRSRKLASTQLDDANVDLEVSYQNGDFVFRAKLLFLMAFVFVALLWLLPRFRAFSILGWVLSLGGFGMLTTAIVMRCVIRSRPPVTNLYDTVLFISATAVLAALVMELINRRRVGLTGAAVLGFGGMQLAEGFGLGAGDTLKKIQAVLDTNFWLATHVTVVTIGYAAGLLAAFLGSLWIAAKIVGQFKRATGRGDFSRGFYMSLQRMVYGVTCFGVLFSLVGTVLGGIWANDSWGRFWGWDPKENGALMIVLAQTVILHGRMGGYLRGFGIAACAALTGIVVAFSWWHVNELQVGLHTYGFTEGVLDKLFIYYFAQIALVVFGASAWWLDRRLTRMNVA